MTIPCSEYQPVTAEVDAAKVERIVDNLLANAIKHSPPGTDIWLRLDENGDGVLLTVEDSGAGVPQTNAMRSSPSSQEPPTNRARLPRGSG
jgi:signal transduction histidine kinase